MPRYLIERTFSEGLAVSSDAPGTRQCMTVVAAGTREGVTWLHSYLAPDRRRSWCICDAPSPESIRAASKAHGWPVDRITEVRVLDPYFLL
jgi:hypothetical protein